MFAEIITCSVRVLSYTIIRNYSAPPPSQKIRVGSYRSYEYHSLQYKNEIRAAAKHVRQFLLYSYSIIADSTLVNNSKIITEASSDVNKSSIILLLDRRWGKNYGWFRRGHKYSLWLGSVTSQNALEPISYASTKSKRRPAWLSAGRVMT